MGTPRTHGAHFQEAGQEAMRCGHGGALLTAALFPSAEPTNPVSAPSRLKTLPLGGTEVHLDGKSFLKDLML